ncbi:retrovirus-related pol polyprotein from transposon TNT 1-94 [Tanacetum coccineum]
MDLFGTVKPQTISHNKYNLVIVDEYSRKIENLNEVRVKELRSDNEIEFRNHKLEEFCDEKGISQNFSSPYTPKQNGVAERRNRTLIEAANTMLNRRFSDISYFYVFGCPMHIYNHKDHLGKFDEKVDDGFFFGYSLVDKSFRVFNIRRQEMKETVHVTFSEDDEAISQSSTEGDAIKVTPRAFTRPLRNHGAPFRTMYAINFNENRSFPDDEYLGVKSLIVLAILSTFPTYLHKKTPSDSPILQNSVSSEEPPKFTVADDHPAPNELD